jgi:hypothetical protein
MKALSAQDILAVWDVGQSQTPTQRALTLLAASCPETSSEELAGATIGARDKLLLNLREKIFGSQFVGLANCPDCEVNLELAFNSSELQADEAARPETETFSINWADQEFFFRLPDSNDLLLVERHASVYAIRKALLARCLLKVSTQGEDVEVIDLSDEIADRVADEMGKRDPQADVRLLLACPNCNQRWEANFDIASFLWDEICGWAGRLLREVHTIALAYGWREVDILNLSAWRRRAYLEMLGE